MLLGRGRAATQLDAELREHLVGQIDEFVAAGMSAEEARSRALRAFGNPALLLREQTRAAWSWNRLDSLSRELRYGFRTLRRAPGFTAIAISCALLTVTVLACLVPAWPASRLDPLRALRVD
jgi:putative ABC transport system permease protein